MQGWEAEDGKGGQPPPMRVPTAAGRRWEWRPLEVLSTSPWVPRVVMRGFSPPDHYMQVLSCKQGCVTELASQPGREKPLEDFLPSHFNYLQFAYYNSKQLLAPSSLGRWCWALCSAWAVLHR